MKTIRALLLTLLCVVAFSACRPAAPDLSGTYCLNLQNYELTLYQDGTEVTFSISTDQLSQGTGTLSGDTLELSAPGRDGITFHATLTFADDSQSFSGTFDLTDTSGQAVMQGLLSGAKGACPTYDLDALGVPQFVMTDYTDLAMVERISRFRSGFGHHYGDGSEPCRSMKHYYNPYERFRQNNTVPIYAPADGYIITVTDDGHGASIGLTNKQVHIRPDAQPAFTFVIFHIDLLSEAIVPGKPVRAGEQVGFARLYYEDLGERATSFDIAVWVNTPAGPRVVSYIETLDDGTFGAYLARGAQARQDFIIGRAERDADPLVCNGEAFQGQGALANWVDLR